MTDSEDIHIVLEILKAAGLAVERIPEANESRCDLRAYGDEASYLIEVKGFHPNHYMVETIRRGSVYTSEHRSFRSARVAGTIDDATRQLDETARSYPHDLRIVALFVRNNYNRELTRSQIIGTLYGITSIVDLEPRGPLNARDCLYFHHSALFRHRNNLDGVLLFDDIDAGLILNDFSPRLERVRASRLGRFFRNFGLLHDVLKLEREGAFLVADCAIDRNDHFGVLKYLATKYALKQPVYVDAVDFMGAFQP